MELRRVIAITACAAAASLSVTAPAFADNGKSAFGCSNPYTLVTYNLTNGELLLPDGNPEPNTLNGLTSNPPLFTTDGAGGTLNVDALYQALDHNGDGALCIKVPSGWNTPNNGNNRAGLFVNLTDDKILS